MRSFVPYNALARRGFIGRPRADGGNAVDPATVMAAFDRYNAAFTKVTDDLGESIDDLAQQISMMKVGGIGGGSRAGSTPEQKAYAASFSDYFRKGREPDNDVVVKAAMQEGSGPDGGWLAPVVVDQAIQDQLIALSPLRGLAQIDTISTGGTYRFFVNRRGTNSGWVGENEERPETNTAQLVAIDMQEGEIYAMPSATQRLLDDATFDIPGFIATNVSDEFSLQEGEAFITGASAKQPKGILSLPTSTAPDGARPFWTLQYVPTGAATDFAATDQADCLVNLVYAVRAPYRAGPGVSWLMNSDTAGAIRKFKDSTGRFIWTDALTAGQPATLLGYPVAIDENMPAIGAGAYPIAYGNWKRGYRILDRIGVRVLRDPYTQKGKVLFYTTKRVGGSPADSNAIKLLKVAAS